MGFGGPPMGMRGRPGARPGLGGGPGAGAGSSRPSLRTAFISLQNRNYRMLWLSQVVSFTGMQMQMIARGWLAFELTGSFAMVGIVMMSWGIPGILFSLLGGALADRMNKRNVVLGSQLATGVLALITAVLITVGWIDIPTLFVLGLLQGTFFAFNMPARQALLAELVSPRELMNAIALNNMAMNGTRIIAPALAGVLIAAWGVDAAYYAQTVMYIFVLLFMLRLPPSTSHLQGASERGNVMQEIGVGLKYVAGRRTMLGLMVMAFVPITLGMSYFTLLPGFAVSDLGLEPGGYGFMIGISGVGALVGSFLIATLTDFPRKGLLQIVIGFGYGASLFALGAASVGFGYGGALVALAALGLFSASYMTVNNTMIMAETRPEFYGRVMSVYMLTFSIFPLMAWPLGVVADQIGATTTFMILGGGITVFMALALLVSPRQLTRRTRAPQGFPGAGMAGPGGSPRAAGATANGASPEPAAATNGASAQPVAAPSGPSAQPVAATNGAAARSLTPGGGSAPVFTYAVGTNGRPSPNGDGAVPALASANGNGARAIRPAGRRDYFGGPSPEAPDYMESGSVPNATPADAARTTSARLPAATGSGGSSNGGSGRRPSQESRYGLLRANGGGDAASVYGVIASEQRAPAARQLSPPAASTAPAEDVSAPVTDAAQSPPPAAEQPAAAAPPAAPPAVPPATLARGDAPARAGGFAPSTTERVDLPVRRDRPPRSNSQLIVTGLTASFVTALLSLLLRGRKDS